jgi:hypothetical protein
MNVMVKLSLDVDVNASTMSGKGGGLARQLGAELLQFARWRGGLARGSNSLLQFSVVYCGVFFGELVNLTARNANQAGPGPDGVWTQMRSPERVDRDGRVHREIRKERQDAKTGSGLNGVLPDAPTMLANLAGHQGQSRS